MPAGRPTNYNQEVYEKAKEYLNTCIDTEEQNKIKVKLPSLEGLAVYLGIGRDMVYEWKSKHQEFSLILEDILAEQAKRLINNGLAGTYNSTIAKLILTKHNYSDRQELTGKDGERLMPEAISPEDKEKLLGLIK